MKVVILAGGYGTRLGNLTQSVPKPMVNVGERPILWHIMKHFAAYGHKEFYLALGYKSEVIKTYFSNYKALNTNFSIDLESGQVQFLGNESEDWKVTLVDTGLDTQTGSRLKLLESYINDDQFMVTYGDGLSDLDLNKLISFHDKTGSLVTLTAVRPPARFGDLGFEGHKVSRFAEKPQLGEGWINGGFFVCQSDFFGFLNEADEMLEREPIQRLIAQKQLSAFKHGGFWQCMDTNRDRLLLNELWSRGQAPWKI